MVLFLFMARFNNFERVIIEVSRFLIIIIIYAGINFYIFVFKVFNISTLFNIISIFRLFLICNIIFLVITVSVKLISLYNAPLKRE